ncbi:MAG: PAS domain S-box protein [Methanoregula sp.]|jgi:PAS domain S-box-containing protein|uniref:PAS domain S-box protein n=1 Tax=Methanoregula sp. TaxID=2052170 RepID=UPI0025FB0196|nr:PAS domain S-box protein [Methanoregula sp.]MCK9630360.1 PAS domain S-box protein [Methanoregula sp.]
MPAHYSILYVDDEPDLLELGRLFLEQSGQFSVSTAESGSTAMEMMVNQSFDAIISDYQMPECNGLRFLRALRRSSDIPFILFTGKGREEVVIEAINSGADFYLQKGGDARAQFAELGHKVLQAISRRQAEQALHNRVGLIRQASVASTRFIRLPADQIDGAISELLAEIGRQAGADRCYLARDINVSGHITWTHEWVAEGIPSLKEMVGTMAAGAFPPAPGRAQSFETVRVESVAALPSEPEEAAKYKDFLQALGIKSYLLVPLTAGPVVIGTLGLDTTRKEAAWPDEDVDILKIYAQIIANALARRNADRAIHESEEIYRTVFESTGTAMMILGENKIVIKVNREFEKIAGYSRTEIEGKLPWTLFVSSEDVQRMAEYHRQRREDPASVPRNYEFSFISRDGSRVRAFITVVMIPGTKKSIVSIIDITELERARTALVESEEKFRSLAESMMVGIYMIQDNRFVYVNPAFAALFSRSADELLALPDFVMIFIEEDRKRILQAVQKRIDGITRSEQYSVRGLMPDGKIMTIEILGSKTHYQGKTAIIGTMTRVS